MTQLESCLDKEENIQKFVIKRMSKIGIKFPWRISVSLKSDIQSVKNVDKSNPSITDHYSGLLIYLTKDKKVLEKYEKQKKYCWGFGPNENIYTRGRPYTGNDNTLNWHTFGTYFDFCFKTYAMAITPTIPTIPSTILAIAIPFVLPSMLHY